MKTLIRVVKLFCVFFLISYSISLLAFFPPFNSNWLPLIQRYVFLILVAFGFASIVLLREWRMRKSFVHFPRGLLVLSACFIFMAAYFINEISIAPQGTILDSFVLQAILSGAASLSLAWGSVVGGRSRESNVSSRA